MKPEDTPDELTPLLREWRIPAEESPRFEEEVWRRIAAEESAATPSWSSALWAYLRGGLNPAWGLAVVLLSVGIGAGFGHRAAETSREEQWSSLSQRYANSINPLAMAASQDLHAEVAVNGPR